MKFLRVALISVLLVFASGCIGAPPEGSPYRDGFLYLNDRRVAEVGRGMHYDLELERMASDWAAAQCGGIRHRNLWDVLNGPYGSWQALGEVIAWGINVSARRAVDAWFNSPGHRGVLLDLRYVSMGWGHARCANGWDVWVVNTGTYW